MAIYPWHLVVVHLHLLQSIKLTRAVIITRQIVVHPKVLRTQAPLLPLLNRYRHSSGVHLPINAIPVVVGVEDAIFAQGSNAACMFLFVRRGNLPKSFNLIPSIVQIVANAAIVV